MVIDTQWFGNYLPKDKNLKIIKDDIRNINDIKLKNISTVIHLANIANDPSVDLNPVLSWDVNVLSTKLLLDKCVKLKIKNLFMQVQEVYMELKKKKK